MLIYIGTPMVAASLWKRSDIDRIEASLYRKVLRVGNMVSNRAILNTMTNIRLAGEVTNYLSKEAWEHFRRQTESLRSSPRKEKLKERTVLLATDPVTRNLYLDARRYTCRRSC